MIHIISSAICDDIVPEEFFFGVLVSHFSSRVQCVNMKIDTLESLYGKDDKEYIIKNTFTLLFVVVVFLILRVLKRYLVHSNNRQLV